MDKVVAFRTILLVHVCVQSWHYLYLRAAFTRMDLAALLVVGGVTLLQTMCLAASFWPRLASWVPLVVLPTLLFQVSLSYPSTTNHFYLSVWLMLL